MPDQSLGTQITEERLDRLRQRVGVPRTLGTEISHESMFNTEVTRDTIRHFAYGLGDDNPLWSDEQYALASARQGLSAPPSFLVSCGIGYTGGLAGVHSLYSGAELEFNRPLTIGDHVTAVAQLLRLDEKQGSYAGRMFEQFEEVTYSDQHGQQVGRLVSHLLRIERDTARGRGKYRAVELARYSDEEIEAVENEIESYRRRGAEPRYWEGVATGDQLGPLVKGPLTVADNIAWVMGAGSPFIKANSLGLAYRRRHPHAFVKNEQGVPDVAERVHWDSAFATGIGAPGPYDYGVVRIAWLSQLVTDWVGDSGELTSISGRLERFNVIGDVVRISGTVVGKRIENGEGFVDLDLHALNQRGEDTCPGRATARLPMRDSTLGATA